MSNETKLEEWKNFETNDLILKKELNMKTKNLSERFSKSLHFGTTGIRALMGLGTNRINEHTVAMVALSYSKISNKTKNSKTVIIGHDCRENSKMYSEIVAKILKANGIKALLLPNEKNHSNSVMSYAIKKNNFDGGIMITATNYPKDYNGIVIYDSTGALLNKKTSDEMERQFKEIDPLKIEYKNEIIDYMEEGMLNDYVDSVVRRINVFRSEPVISVAFTPLNGAGIEIAPKIFNKMNIKNYMVDKESDASSFTNKEFPTNPNESKAYDKVLSLARRKKADLAIALDPSMTTFGAVVKHKRRYKYLDANQTAALYLNYKLTKLKQEGKFPKDGYIVKSMVSSDLISRIAETFKVKVLETHVGFQNVSEVIDKTKGTFLFAYEESYGFLLDESLTRERDASQAMVGFLEMANFFKTNESDLYSELKKLYKKFGIFRSTQFGKVVKESDSKNIMRHILSLNEIGGVKVKEIQDYRKGYEGHKNNNLIKVVMENGSWFAARLSGSKRKIKFYTQTIGEKDQELIDIVIFEKQVRNYISGISEVFENKNFSWKVIFKYMIFLGIMAIIIWFTFTTIYDSAKTSGRSATSIALVLFNSKMRSIFLIWILATIIGLLLTSIQRKRLISYHGQKVKMRHVMISSVMGAFISWVTPFTIGGDAIGYWYLRRKGFKRSALASSYMTSTLIWQFSMIIITAVLVPLGFIMYKDQFVNGDVNMKAVLIIFVTGISWDVFATFMIGMLTFNKRFQVWIVRTSILFLEWLPFIHIQDPGLKAAGPQYEFSQMRSGMKLLFSNKKLMMEAMSYRLIGKFFLVSAFVPMALSIMDPGLTYGSYFSQVVVNDFVRAANGMSITPGGSGTGEYISINLRSSLWREGANGLSAKDTSVGLDMLKKFVSQWPYLIFSVITIGVIITGEKRKDIHEKKNTIRIISNSKENATRSRFYISIIPLWIIFAAGYLTLFYLI